MKFVLFVTKMSGWVDMNPREVINARELQKN